MFLQHVVPASRKSREKTCVQTDIAGCGWTTAALQQCSTNCIYIPCIQKWRLDLPLCVGHNSARAYLRGGGGFRGFKPPEIFRFFFLKSEGKETERKRKKRDVGGGGGYLLTYFWD